ncbi:hypothetical protein ACFWJW_03710 [Streptomyces sp. NPDC127097]|uniref:hypothetical protein n=1 Tax=Streptomyces sp. NPDC127097 TaxID=3347136 RepID=UPI00364B42F6
MFMWPSCSPRAKAGDAPVQCARLFKLAKDSAVKARTQAINQLKAVLITADPDPREQLAGPEESGPSQDLRAIRRS